MYWILNIPHRSSLLFSLVQRLAYNTKESVLNPQLRIDERVIFVLSIFITQISPSPSLLHRPHVPNNHTNINRNSLNEMMSKIFNSATFHLVVIQISVSEISHAVKSFQLSNICDLFNALNNKIKTKHFVATKLNLL